MQCRKKQLIFNLKNEQNYDSKSLNLGDSN